MTARRRRHGDEFKARWRRRRGAGFRRRARCVRRPRCIYGDSLVSPSNCARSTSSVRTPNGRRARAVARRIPRSGSKEEHFLLCRSVCNLNEKTESSHGGRQTCKLPHSRPLPPAVAVPATSTDVESASATAIWARKRSWSVTSPSKRPSWGPTSRMTPAADSISSR